MKFPFNASQKIWDVINGCSPARSLFVNLHLYYFLSFSWSRCETFCMFCICTSSSSTLDFFEQLSCSISFIKLLNQIKWCFIYFSVIGCYSGCFILCSPFQFIFFHKQTVLVTNWSWSDLKKGSSNEFKIATISSHAYHLSTLPRQCIQGWICRFSLKNKMSCCSV